MQVRDITSETTSYSRRLGYEFQDESQDASQRFNSVALLTTTEDGLLRLNDALDSFLGPLGRNEMKWSDIANQGKSDRATGTVQTVIEMAGPDELRVDVLTWDRDDMRHRDVPNPDRLREQVNMRSMLSAWVRSNRWGTNVDWQPLPDQLEGVDWDHMDNAVRFRRRKYDGRMPDRQLLNDGHTMPGLNAHTVPTDSKTSRPIQVCDLFAGIASFSHGRKRGESSNWAKVMHHQEPIPEKSKGFYDGLMGADATHVTRKEKFKIGVVAMLLTGCEMRGFDVRGEAGLETPQWRSEQPINFWLYKTKRKDDRAPSKNTNPLSNLKA